VGPLLALAVATLIPPPSAAAQDAAPSPDSVEARGGAGFFIPLGSLFVPGLGQYLHGATGPGLAFTGTGIAGFAINQQAGGEVDTTLPRDGEEQLATSGALLFAGAGLVSAYDAFRRGLPGLQREGKYEFLTSHASTGDLFTAPFDPKFLGRWTTWVELAYTGAITAIVLSDREEGVEYEPLKARDVAFTTGLSLYAGIGEEALFRGWLLPLFHQSLGERFWVANGVQALLFGAGHVGTASEYAAVIGGWALYEGWLTRRNDWSIRESIFHHFWYDVAVVTAEFVTDQREPVTLVFPTIRF
jgi:membrane protease YdiL (CAAX protease family)